MFEIIRSMEDHMQFNDIEGITFVAVNEKNMYYKNVTMGGGAVAARFADGTIAILIDNKLLDIFDRALLEAVVYHEVGHIKNGDLEKNVKTQFQMMMVDEKPADRYAASKVGWKTVREAIYATAKNTCQGGLNYCICVLLMWAVQPGRMLQLHFSK